LFCATFYHFYVHDKTGLIGSFFRNSVPAAKFVNLDDEIFAACVVAIFMQVMGILQIPAFLGPSFSPFDMGIMSPWKNSSTVTVGKEESVHHQKIMDSQREPVVDEPNENGKAATGGRKRRRNKKKQT
jgi:hypothetical protein